MGSVWTGKKLMENMQTTAINIFATFRRVFNWLSKFRLAEFWVAIVETLGDVPVCSSTLAAVPCLTNRITLLVDDLKQASVCKKDDELVFAKKSTS